MTLFYTISQVNGAVLFVSGFLLNVLLIRMICKRSNQLSDKGYKPILLQACITDLLNLALTFFYMPVYITYGDYVLSYTTGFFNDAFKDGPIFSILIYKAWLFFHTLSVCSPAVQFLYRYLVLCREWRPSYRLYAALLSAVGLILLTYTLTSSLFGELIYVSRSSNALYQEFILTPSPSDVDLILAKDASKLFTLIFGAIIILDYIIIVVSGLKIWLHIRRNFQSVSDSNGSYRRLQRQVNYVLLVQALLPIIGLLIPMSIYTIVAIMKAVIPNMPFIYQFTTLCVMNANPLATILLIESYRRQILGCCSISSKTTTKVIRAVDVNDNNFA